MLTRPLDSLGRIVIPKEIQDSLSWNKKDPIGITIQGKSVILGKLEHTCCLCDVETDLTTLPNGSMICPTCLGIVFETAKQQHAHCHI